MKITLAQNPLESTVELDAAEERELMLRLEIEDLEDRLVEAHCELSPFKGEPDLEKAKKAVDLNFMDGEGRERRQKRLRELFEHYRSELMGSHCGDCTCVPMSCSKCHAEAFVGADTLGKIGKHELAAIGAAFKGEGVSAEEALARLGKPVLAKEAWQHAHVERWEKEREAARSYMRNHLAKLAAQAESAASSAEPHGPGAGMSV